MPWRAGRAETYVVLVFAWDSGPRAIVKMSGAGVDVQWDERSVVTMLLERCNPSCDAKTSCALVYIREGLGQANQLNAIGQSVGE